MSVEELQAALDRLQTWGHAPLTVQVVVDLGVAVAAARLIANPNLKAMGKVNYALSHNDYSEAELQSLFDAALTPGDTDDTKWWEVEHHPRCNIEVLGAEPLQLGGDCTCAALTRRDTDHIPDERPGSLDAPWMDEPDSPGDTKQ